MRRVARMAPLASAVLLSACAPVVGATLNEPTGPDPYPYPGTCESAGIVIDYAAEPAYRTTIEAISAFLDLQVFGGQLTREQGDALWHALNEAPTHGTTKDRIVSEQRSYTVSATIEQAPEDTVRVGQFGLECHLEKPS